jgi:HK97 family phage major capsid protein
MTDACMLEVHDLNHQAGILLARGTKLDVAKATEMRKRAEAIERRGISSDEMRARYAHALNEEVNGNRKTTDKEYRAAFDKYLAGDAYEIETRDFEAGTQSITYTQGTAGGYLVPFEYDPTVREAFAQTDPLLNPDVVDFEMTTGTFLQPAQISGYDLSTVAAVIVGETIQQPAQVIPTVAGAVLKNNLTFRCSFGASMEAEQDVPDFSTKLVRAASVALARGVGQHVISGVGGTTDISGIAKQLTTSYTNATSGKLTLTDFNTIFFSVNRWYRNQKKTGWLVSDGVYKYIRAAADFQGRPLLDVIADQEMLLGKPIYICPSLANAYLSIGLDGALIFGDLSHIVIRASRPTLQRTVQQTITDVTKGEALYVGRMRADAAVFDPSNGGTPPLVLATVN